LRCREQQATKPRLSEVVREELAAVVAGILHMPQADRREHPAVEVDSQQEHTH
jgi:hypothetical protein